MSGAEAPSSQDLQVLRLRIAAQRQQLGAQLGAIESRLSGIDHRLAQARDFLRSPVALSAGVALVLAVGPRRLLRSAGKALMTFATLRRMFS